MQNLELITTGDIARALCCPLHRVTYAVQRFRVREDVRVGSYRLFRRERLAEIAALIRHPASEAPCPTK
ncbi:MAG: hypothetical protein A49_14560 [Methyloceanibacter sp.]|nr:MAG: hypothetical protein A49_14560 [Methyloceanibacter sp.]